MAATDGAGMDTIEALLKEFYIPGINRQVNDETLLLKRLEARSDEIVEGLKVVVSVDLGRTGGIGPARERGALPAAGKQRPERAVYNLKSLYGRGQVTGQSVRSTRSNAAAYARTLKFEADGLQRDLRKDLARQVYGGYDIAGAAAAGGIEASAAIAKLASVGVSTSANGFVLTSDAPIRQGHIYVGMLLDATDNFVSIENTATMEVASVDLATSTVKTVADHAADLAAADFIVRAGTVDADGNAGVTGISAIIGTDAFGGLNPATAGLEEWQSLEDTSGGAFASDDLHALWNQVRQKSGAEPKSIITTFGIIRTYFNELQAQVQYVEPMKLEGGFRVLNFMDRPFIGDVDCPLGSVFLLDEKAVFIAAEGDFAPLDEDGHFLHWVVGYDMWEWALQRDMELIANKRNSSAKMTGLTDVGY